MHTVLSPCGDLEMSPRGIVAAALREKLDIIAITDHNTTLMCETISALAAESGVAVILGVEITTREEAHCVALFDNHEQRRAMQEYLEAHLPFVQNNVDYFGYQVVVDRDDMVVDEIEPLLITALDVPIEAIREKVGDLGGLFIPAHVDRPKNSVIGQLGFIPPDLGIDAVELSKHTTPYQFLRQNPIYGRQGYTYIQSSDAHFVENVGDAHTIFEIESPTTAEIRKALAGADGRRVASTHSKKTPKA